MGTHLRYPAGLVMILAVCASAVTNLEATPQFARQTGRDCSFCHIAPPVLNARGEDFLARGYRFAADTAPAASHERTIPISVWNTLDYERRWDTTTNRAF